MVYFMPIVVAWARGHSNIWQIGTFNVMLGWTVIGWIVAMVWAFVYSKPDWVEIELARAEHSARYLAAASVPDRPNPNDSGLREYKQRPVRGRTWQPAKRRPGAVFDPLPESEPPQAEPDDSEFVSRVRNRGE
ncbi:MAG: superinfection immunity protein [Chloroflexota bacterium]|nr:superinfection immunity protein [Chloroflexota bacterium]